MCKWLEPVDRRKVLFTNGMHPDKMLVITDAPKEKIEEFCRHLNREMEDGVNTYYDFLKKDYYVNVLYDSELTSEREDVDVIGFDESYDFGDFQVDWQEDETESKIHGIIYEHGEDDYGLWEGFNLSKEDADTIQQILSKYDTDGCSVRGTRKEIAAEIGECNPFKEDERYLLSDGMLALIRNMSDAIKLVSDVNVVNVMREKMKECQELNAKICDM